MQTTRLQWLTLRAFVLFILIDIGFGIAGFDVVYERIVRRGRSRTAELPRTSEAARVRDTLAAVMHATRWYYRTRLDCLPKALTLFSLLRNQGIPAELCLGVKRFPFAGHAWVEVNGAVIDTKPEQVRPYTVITRRS
jgi:hypothetical protein